MQNEPVIVSSTIIHPFSFIHFEALIIHSEASFPNLVDMRRKKTAEKGAGDGELGIVDTSNRNQLCASRIFIAQIFFTRIPHRFQEFLKLVPP